MEYLKIKKIEKTNTEPIYHLTVKNNHNFFANNVCVHNCDYRGEIGIIIMNTSDKTFTIEDGDRMAQGVLNQVKQCEWDSVYHQEELGQTDRDSAGFGTSGIK